MSVQIHGKEYVTVAERVKEAGADLTALHTEVLYTEPVIVIQATVTTKKGTFMGISAANPDKAIEKTNPYEVAETSAVGRALGFAGYGIINGIASADEMNKATIPTGTQVVKGTGMRATQKQIGMIMGLLTQKGYSDAELKKKYKIESKNDLTITQASQIIENLLKLPDTETVNPDEIPQEVGA